MSDYKTTPTEDLGQAVRDNDISAAKKALKNGANPNAEFYFGDIDDNIHSHNIMEFVTDPRMARLLLKNGLDIGPNSEALMVAQTEEIAQMLIAAGADVNARYDKRIGELSYQYEQVTGESSGVGPNIVTPLSTADSPERVRLLIAAGASVSSNDFHRALGAALDAIESAEYNSEYEDYKDFAMEKLEILQHMINSGQIDGKDLAKAFEEVQVPAVTQILLNHGLDKDVLNRSLVNANNSPEKTAQIIAAGADIKGPDGVAALHSAVRSEIDRDQMLENRLENIKLLLNNGVDVNAKDADGFTALHYAAAGSNYYSEYLRLLIDSDADVNSKNNAGQTPLMLAASHLDEIQVNILIENGANPAILDNNGWSALDYATGRALNNGDEQEISDELFSKLAVNYDGSTWLGQTGDALEDAAAYVAPGWVGDSEQKQALVAQLTPIIDQLQGRAFWDKNHDGSVGARELADVLIANGITTLQDTDRSGAIEQPELSAQWNARMEEKSRGGRD